MAEISIAVNPAILGAAIGLAGVLAGLWVNGDRAERERTRALHARALAAILAYYEMPFMIRRRCWEEAEQSRGRVRIADHFSAIKAEISTCQVLLGAEGNQRVAKAYDDLVRIGRETVGDEARQAWADPPVKSDAEMTMTALYCRLEAFRTELSAFEEVLAAATLPRRLRLRRRLDAPIA